MDELLRGGRACFGAAELGVIGWLAPSWGIGGVGSGIVPSWLGEPLTDPVLWLKPRNPAGCFTDDDCMWAFVHVRPGTGLAFALPERWVDVTGHFDDPAAMTCTWNGTNDPVTPERAIEVCRNAFVATAAADAVAPPGGTLPMASAP